MNVVRNIIILLSIALLGVAGYYLIVTERASTIGGVNDANVGSAEAESRIFVQQLNELNQLTIDTSIFSDPRFNSLVDYTDPVPNLPAGRSNPFEPFIGSGL